MTPPEVKNIRLLHIIDNLDRGGTQTWFMSLVKGLAELGFEQRIYCLNEIANIGIVESLKQSGSQVTILGRPQLYGLIGLIRLYRAIKSWQPDIAQTILPYGNLLGRPVARLAGAPIVVSSIRTRNAHKSKLHLFLDRLTADWADVYIAVSRQIIPFAVVNEGVSPDKIIYIANGLEIDRQDRSQARATLRAQLNISAKTKVLGMVARLSPQKAHDDLLRAYAIVVAEYPDTTLLLVGDGPLRQKLERQASRLKLNHRVIFLGDRPDVKDLLAAMDLFAHPSLFEGMPNAVMEAMAAGLPVIASAVDGVQDLIVDGESGWLVEPGNVTQLTERIIFALENHALWPAMGRAAVHRIATEFSSSKMIAAYSSVYRDLAARKAAD
jgi:glycosyltransferase involved in cell wall biosynthesis